MPFHPDYDDDDWYENDDDEGCDWRQIMLFFIVMSGLVVVMIDRQWMCPILIVVWLASIYLRRSGE